jgi:hypothetical protein
LDRSDLGVIEYLLAEARAPVLEAAARPLAALRSRRLYKGVVTSFFEEHPPDVSRQLVELYARGAGAPDARLRVARLLEDNFGLRPGSIALYCPDKGMNAKIAEVKIHVNGSVASFHKWEDEHGNTLSGGHLAAQRARFQRLWRIHVFLERSAYEGLSTEVRRLLQQAVHDLVLTPAIDRDDLRAAALALARLGSQVRGMPFYGKKVGDAVRIGARNDAAAAADQYPSGAPSLRAYFEE